MQCLKVNVNQFLSVIIFSSFLCDVRSNSPLLLELEKSAKCSTVPFLFLKCLNLWKIVLLLRACCSKPRTDKLTHVQWSESMYRLSSMSAQRLCQLGSCSLIPARTRLPLACLCSHVMHRPPRTRRMQRRHVQCPAQILGTTHSLPASVKIAPAGIWQTNDQRIPEK